MILFIGTFPSESLDTLQQAVEFIPLEILKEPLDSIHNEVKSISGNTHYAPWVLLNTLLATIGVVASIGAAYYSHRTATNVSRVNIQTQKYLFISLVRHLYRNKICTLAVAANMKMNSQRRPSDEHILKLKTLPEDVHVEIYNDQPVYYAKMHEIRLLLRNYNTEIDVFKSNLESSLIPLDEKHLGIQNLLFKPLYIIFRIADIFVPTDNPSDKISHPKNIITAMITEHCNKYFEDNTISIQEDLPTIENILNNEINIKSLNKITTSYKDLDLKKCLDGVFSPNNMFASINFKKALEHRELTNNDLKIKKDEVEKGLRSQEDIEGLLKFILVRDALIEYTKIRMLNFS